MEMTSISEDFALPKYNNAGCLEGVIIYKPEVKKDERFKTNREYVEFVVTQTKKNYSGDVFRTNFVIYAFTNKAVETLRNLKTITAVKVKYSLATTKFKTSEGYELSNFLINALSVEPLIKFKSAFQKFS